MLFSVIIPTFNRASLVRETVQSVLDQEGNDFEIIVVDDGSTDDTRAVLAEFGERVQVFTQQNRGPGAARNFGASQARGRYLAFLDSDDVWFPWTLAAYRELATRADSPSFIAGSPLRFASASQLSSAAPEPVRFQRFSDYLASSDEWAWWGVSSFVIRADAFARTAGFLTDNVNGEDADLALKLGDAPGFCTIRSPSTFGFRMHGQSLTADWQKTLAGVWRMIAAEQAGAYPGGPKRRQLRCRIVTRHIRPVVMGCLRRGMAGEAWRLYRATFRWQLAAGRWKYLFGFPFVSIFHSVRIDESSAPGHPPV